MLTEEEKQEIVLTNTVVGDVIDDVESRCIKKFEEMIDKTYKELDMGKTIPIFIQRVKKQTLNKKVKK